MRPVDLGQSTPHGSGVGLSSISPINEGTIVNSVVNTRLCIAVDLNRGPCELAFEISAIASALCVGRLQSAIIMIGRAFKPRQMARCECLDKDFNTHTTKIVPKIGESLNLKLAKRDHSQAYIHEREARASSGS
jgi:pyruvate/2-oxoglutarate/acetoin dehydrogenase E1 component